MSGVAFSRKEAPPGAVRVRKPKGMRPAADRVRAPKRMTAPDAKSGSYVSPLRLSPRPPRPRGWRLLTRTASLESPGTRRALGLRAPRVLQMTGAALRRGGVVLVLALAALAAPLSVAQAQTVLSSISFTGSPASGDTYTRGERIAIRVGFDGDVEVSNPHLLRLALKVGSVTEQVARIGAIRHEACCSATR